MSSGPAAPILRLAPSPNGYLHLGHAYSALVTQQWARAMGGQLLLRIEDIDRARCKPAFAEQILNDLRWLGLRWPEPVLYQSTRFSAYKKALDRLAALDLLYLCFCSRADILAAASDTDPDGTPLYPGTCRSLSPAQVQERLSRNAPAHYRLKNDRARALAGFLSYPYSATSPLEPPKNRPARPERWGDVVLRRKDTPTSYHLSVVVDDAAQQITHVTRGRDMEAATDLHILLQFLLGLRTPAYCFHELILDETGRKLSKSASSPSLHSLRAAGWTPQKLRRHLGLC